MRNRTAHHRQSYAETFSSCLFTYPMVWLGHAKIELAKPEPSEFEMK